ncbi:MAG TPA: MFS transporter [Opitutaceae bacterium]|nr:MFS transporter [Opitutaceae bacterium]
MTNPAAVRIPGAFSRVPFYYGWVTVGLAALAMVGTLPGRTQGLGLITEPLLKDLQVDRVAFAQMNLWATLIGSLFCLGTGRLLDQFGARSLFTVVALALGAVTLAMSGTSGVTIMFLLLILSRGFGQNALSVVSLTMVGQWFARRLSLAMAIYSIALSIGFMTAFPVVGGAVLSHGWRAAWAAIGWCLVLGVAPLGLLLVRNSPPAGELAREGETALREEGRDHAGHTWGQALRTPAFWVFALASSVYNLIASGIGLFNESVLAERGFGADIYHRSLVITALTSLVGNFLGGWLASKWSMSGLLAVAMGLLAAALLGVPSLTTLWHVDLFAVVMGVAGGFVIVLFFTVWARAFGRTQLGRIQGSAQMLTVLASAVGPLLLAKCQAWTGSYSAIFYVLAACVALLGLAAWRVRLPRAG